MTARISLGRLAVVFALAATLIVAVACGGNSSPTASNSDTTPTPKAAEKVTAPAFSAATYSGGTFDLDSLQGKPVVINFWFPSCAPCKAEMPDIQAAYEKYGNKVAFVGVQQISLNSKQEGKDFLSSLGIQYPNFGDDSGKVQFEYGVLNYPTTVFLNSNHQINRTWTGLISSDHLDEQIQAILGS